MSSSSAATTEMMGQSWLTGLGDALDAMAPAPVANSDAPPAPAAAHTPPPTSGYAITDGYDRDPSRPGAADHDTTVKYVNADPLQPTHDKLEEYGQLMRRMVSAAQLDDRFIDRNFLEKWFGGLGALGMMPGPQRVRLMTESGLPTFSSWAQVNAVAELARRPTAGARTSRVGPLFTNLPPFALNTLKVDVLDIDPTTHMRQFRIISDRWVDPGFIVRTAAYIEQPLHEDKKKKRSNMDREAPMQLVDGEWVPRRKLLDALTTATGSSPAKFALTAMHLCDGALVKVSQGLVGPVWFKGAQVDDLIGGILDVSPNNTVACFTAFELHRDPPKGDVVPWIDPGDPSLERMRDHKWYATVDRLWVTTAEISGALEEYARELDPTLKIRSVF